MKMTEEMRKMQAEFEFDDYNLPLSFQQRRHDQPIEGIDSQLMSRNWRLKERMKTVSVALVLCLNVGVDPPDLVKIVPCARLECWFDPSSVSPQKALELIGSTLQKQYERWQPKARYKQSLDPTVDDVKKLCTSLRRNAKEERVLFHYNGHGVPRPTQNGEIWVFNRNYTQYIPLSIYDLQTWMGAPSIYVYDCSNAGIIVNSFNNFAEQHELEQTASSTQIIRGTPPTITTSTINQSSATPNPMTTSAGGNHQSYKNCIQLAACAADQILPMNPELPADLFTACLTTPIKTALKWFSMRPTSKLVPHVTYEMIENIPGVLNDRRTMLGELNWIFTAITDTIAWNTLPRELFQTLFRQDLLVASLFRNFLLADRILRSYDCTPVSNPSLPPTFRHPMWAAWDLALDVALSQLPDILANKKQYTNSPFFEEQLTAFQVWLEGNPDQKTPPEQLPIVLQVLLSQAHRLRALELLERFLDIGGWAVNLALNVGIFPYVLRLLTSPAVELRPYLVFIWAKILAVDYTCQVDIVRENVDCYFLAALHDPTIVFNQFDCRTFAAFVLSCIVYKFEQGQANALKGSLVSICLEQINDTNPILRKWFAICLGNLWQNFEAARGMGARDLAQEKLYSLLKDPVPEVRAATVYALGTFISSTLERTSQDNDLDRQIAVHMLELVSSDMSPLVRMELVSALQWIVKLFDSKFVDVCLREDPYFNGHLTSNSSNSSLTRMSSGNRLERSTMKAVSSCSSIVNMAYSAIYSKLWHGIYNLSRDPYPDVAQMGFKVTDYIRQQALEMTPSIAIIPLAKEAFSDRMSTSGGSNSYSLPPSPNTRSINFNNEQTHTSIASTKSPSPYQYLNHHSASTVRLNSTATDSSTNWEQKPHKLRVPIVKTNLIEWEISSFARPLKYLAANSRQNINSNDEFAMETVKQKERFRRNVEVRNEAREQQRNAVFHSLKGQCFICKTAHTPSIVKLYPYEPQIAVAYLDRIMLNDWNLNVAASLSPMQLNSPTLNHGNSATIQTTTNSSKRVPATASALRVTSIQFINAHDRGLIMAGYDDGSVRIWRNSIANNCSTSSNNIKNSIKESNLVTAFQALDDQPTRSSKLFGLQTEWHQNSQTIIVGGESKVLRLWDAEKELKIQDIQSGSDFPVSHISSAPNGLFAVGFADGCIKIYDRRNNGNGKIMTYREHSQSLLTICLRSDCESLVSGCSNGEIRLFDIRTRTSVQNWSAGSDITNIAVHATADIVACAGQYISIHGLDGTQLNTIQCHEGFMGPRIGQTSCLSFHPHKVSLAAGFVDNTVCVYTV